MNNRRRKQGLFSLTGLVILAVLLVLSPNPAFCDETIDEINAAIEAAGANWVAAENPVTRMSPEERRKLLGAMEDTAGPEAEASAAAPRGAALPTQLDWRNIGGSNYVSSVKNQGGCGSCFCFAPVAALESKYMITNSLPGSTLDLSEQIVLSCSTAGDCTGGYASTASDFLKNTGTAVESCYPYTVSKGPCSNACTNWQDETYYFTSWSYANSGEVATSTEIKNAIYNNGPVVVWYKVYSDFYSYSTGVYTKTSGTYEGNHFVLVVGWNDSNNSFICKNSWGSSWGGLGGYFNIGYSQLAGDVQFGYWTYQYGSAYGPSVDWYAAYRTMLPVPGDLALFRAYRDKVMEETAFGQFCSGMIYNQADNLLRVLLTHPRLLIQARQLVKANRAAVQSVVQGGFGTIENTDEVMQFMGDVADCSPLDLRVFLNQLETQMQRHRAAGEPFLGFFLQ
ncbi:C1 family peptidase [Desulfatiglans anilini]|uniref:C1 family peptidase n=1 Tax=Desulfatiglans anilini TaxID=90728 RepID=UPI0003FC3382|nr:C1 family peptidase [Desulfatiglans anilini]